MNWTKMLRIISNIAYIVGGVITLCLGIISLFGSILCGNDGRSG